MAFNFRFFNYMVHCSYFMLKFLFLLKLLLLVFQEVAEYVKYFRNFNMNLK